MCPARGAQSASLPATAGAIAGTHVSRSRCAERIPAGYGGGVSGHVCVPLALRRAACCRCQQSPRRNRRQDRALASAGRLIINPQSPPLRPRLNGQALTRRLERAGPLATGSSPRPARTCHPRPASRWQPPPARDSDERPSLHRHPCPVRTRPGPVPPPLGATAPANESLVRSFVRTPSRTLRLPWER